MKEFRKQFISFHLEYISITNENSHSNDIVSGEIIRLGPQERSFINNHFLVLSGLTMKLSERNPEFESERKYLTISLSDGLFYEILFSRKENSRLNYITSLVKIIRILF